MMKIYGNEVDLEDPQTGDTITDVLVLARAVQISDDGTMADALLVSSTPQTTSMIQKGMLAHLGSMLDTEDNDEE